MLNKILEVDAHNSFSTCLEMRSEQLILYCTDRLVSSDRGKGGCTPNPNALSA
jgi:hypothetical protein